MKWIIESVGVNTHLYLFLYLFYVADATQTP